MPDFPLGGGLFRNDLEMQSELLLNNMRQFSPIKVNDLLFMIVNWSHTQPDVEIFQHAVSSNSGLSSSGLSKQWVEQQWVEQQWLEQQFLVLLPQIMLPTVAVILELCALVGVPDDHSPRPASLSAPRRNEPR